MICQSEGGHLEEGRNCQQSPEAAWGERPEERLSHRPWSVRKLNTVGERWSTACINNFLSPDRLPWRGQTTWRLCGSSRGSSCWRSDWQEGLVLYVWTSPLLQRPPRSLLWAPAWCCFLRFGRRSCQQDWTCGTSEGWTSDLSYLIWRIQNGEMHWAPLYSPLQAWRSVLCWNFPNLNATDQVAPDEDYRWTGPIFLPPLSFCCSCRLLQFMWPPPLLPPSTFCGSRNASMFPTELPQRTVPDVSETSPGLCWCKVGENGVGGGCSSWRTRTHRSVSVRATVWASVCTKTLVPPSICWVVCLTPVPLEVRANYRIYNLCLAAARWPALKGLLCVLHQSLDLTKKLELMY